MASPSLEELLAEEGFKGRGSKPRSRASFGSEGMSMPLYLYKGHNQMNSLSSVKIRPERTRSDVARHSVASEFSKFERVTSRRPRDNLIGNRRIAKVSSRKGLGEIEASEEKGLNSNSGHEIKRVNARLSVDLPGSEIVHEENRTDVQETHTFKDISSNEISESERNWYSNGVGEKGKYKERSNKHLTGHTSFSNDPRKSWPRPESSQRKPTEITHNNKTFENLRSRKHLTGEPSVPQPALDQVAIQATVSILSGYIKCFLKDKEFRESLRHSCSSCLISTKLEEGHHADNKVIENLEEAIETVERVAEESENTKDLKKASLQLSVVTGLNSKDLRDGFTSGIPNSQLSACAHLYLSVIYKMQKKDRVSAKHILQVFCDSPFQARTSLLSELWDYLFLPHLSHLKVWYDQEVATIPDTSSKPRKLKFLDKVYNEILDSGTYQFAVYYKDWLTEGVEAPSIPSIHIPSVSIQGLPKGGSHAPSPEIASPIGSQPMVSKKLYDSVFCGANKLDGVGELEAREEDENFDNCTSSFDGTAEEDKRTVTHSPEQGSYTQQSFQEATTKSIEADASHPVDGLVPTIEEEMRSPRGKIKEEKINGEIENFRFGRITQESSHALHMLPHKKANELTLKKLAESIFQQSLARTSTDYTAGLPMSYSQISIHDTYKLNNTSSHVEGQYLNDEYFEEGSFFSSIPKDFVCPLTAELFEDPVTLETGRTFEQKAIKEWFDKGNRTCPVTGRTLECLGVPITNFVLKRVIDSWKSEHCKNLLAFASKIAGSSFEHGSKSKDERAVFILEQLLIGFKTEERLMNVKHLISLGGLQFLIRRFELGNLGEKARIVALLSCCIEADGSCRNYIAKNINKACVLELLHNKQVKSRANVVILLTELVFLNRGTEIKSFLCSLQKDGIMNTMHVLLVHLQSSPPDQRPLIAVLLLHFDLLVEPRKYSIYREEAVDSITVSLECSLVDEKVRAQCCRALLILGGHFSSSGEMLVENWLLRKAGFCDGCVSNYLNNTVDNFQINETILLAEEEKERDDWWKDLTASLLGTGKKSFLDIISKCLGSGDSNLARTCLITTAWLSQALTLMSDAEFQLSAFSALIPQLKENLENGKQVEYRVLASMILLNFSKIAECRVLLMTIAEEIMIPLQRLAEVTWTAKQLHAIISGEGL